MSDLLLDANVMVRFLVQDDPKQGAAATTLFKRAERRELVLHLEGLVAAEVVSVLLGRHGRTRAEVVNVLLAIIQNSGVETVDQDIVTDALRRFAAVNVDFSDAWLAARAGQSGHPVASFDRDFDKFKDIRRFEPKS